MLWSEPLSGILPGGTEKFPRVLAENVQVYIRFEPELFLVEKVCSLVKGLRWR